MLSNGGRIVTARTLITTYYGPNSSPDPYAAKPVVKITHSSVRSELLPNICRHMTRNDYGAIVATAHEADTGELLLVVTYDIGSYLRIVFEPDASKPVCITTI